MPRIEDYDYFLPPELVAQYPLAERDASRLLVLHRDGGEIRHAGFRELAAALDENDVLVVNDTRVFPARLLGHKDSGGKVELLLHHLPEAEANGAVPQAARARATHRGRLKIGQILNFGAELTAAVLALPAAGGGGGALHRSRRRRGGRGPGGGRSAPAALYPASGRGGGPGDLSNGLCRPRRGRGLPHRRAPLHRDGVARPGPPGGRDRAPHPARGAGDVYAGARRGLYPAPDGRRNTSSYPRPRPPASTPPKRQANAWWRWAPPASGCWSPAPRPRDLQAQQGWCDLYLYPGYQFKAVDRLLTNFHLPKSTLLLLVSAFAGRDLILRAYEEAV